MTKMSVSEILQIIRNAGLSEDDMLQINRFTADAYRNQQREKQLENGLNFNIGDIISFIPTQRKYYGQRQYIKVEGFNRSRTAIVGRSVHEDGTPMEYSVKWTVANSFCTLHKTR